MTRAQEYIHALMENVAEGQIGSDEHRLTFARIGRKLSSAEDFESELRQLYKVVGLSQFTLGLMWIADRVERNEIKKEYTTEEQSFVVSNFRYAVGDTEEPPLWVAQQSQEEVTAGEPEVQAEPAPPEEETLEMPRELQMETPGESQEPGQLPGTPPQAPAGGSEAEFAKQMEKFVEAVQSGSEDRDGLVQSVLSQSTSLSAEGSTAPGDLREFCQYFVEFLQYILENGFIDDVRVMNIVSNVSGPVSSWAQASPDAREGLLSEGTEILKSFKSLFE